MNSHSSSRYYSTSNCGVLLQGLYYSTLTLDTSTHGVRRPKNQLSSPYKWHPYTLVVKYTLTSSTHKNSVGAVIVLLPSNHGSETIFLIMATIVENPTTSIKATFLFFRSSKRLQIAPNKFYCPILIPLSRVTLGEKSSLGEKILMS